MVEARDREEREEPSSPNWAHTSGCGQSIGRGVPPKEALHSRAMERSRGRRIRHMCALTSE